MNVKRSAVPVTVLGLGAVGTALAAPLLRNGHPTTVWNRTTARAEPLVAAGATGAHSVREAVTASPLVITCLLDDATVREVLEPAAGVLSGRTLLNLTNGTPEQARAAASWANGHAIDYLDGGIMAIPPMIGGPEAVILYSGSPTAHKEYQDVWKSFGQDTHLGADAGLAALYDLALLSGMCGMCAGFQHAVAMVRTEGTQAEEFTTSLLVPWLQATMTTLAPSARETDSGSGAGPDAQFAMQAAAYVNLLDASRSQGISTQLAAPYGDLLRQAADKEAAREEFSSLTDLLTEQEPQP